MMKSVLGSAAVVLLWLSTGSVAEELPHHATDGKAQESADDGENGKPAHGRWRFRTHRSDPGLSPKQRDAIERLEALGYLGGVKKARQESNVVVHDPGKAFPGLNLYASGHAPQAILMDMDGNELHRWHYNFDEVWPDYPLREKDRPDTFWRRVHLLEDGDLLAIFEGLGIIKLDKDSNLIWASPVRAHHDLEVTVDGRIYVLTREAHIVPRINEEEPILEDFISELDSSGKEVRRISILEAFEHSEYRDIWMAVKHRKGDVFHTNTLRLLDGRLAEVLPAFKKGNFLISILWINTIAIVDPGQKKVVWAHRGTFRNQHDPKLLDNGNILLFDNRGVPKNSRVLEINPKSGEVEWIYRGNKLEPLYSATCGTAERLPNGNTLIVESDNGRALEVGPEGQIVWEFVSPHRAGKDNEFVATVMQMTRLPARTPLDWLARSRQSSQPNLQKPHP